MLPGELSLPERGVSMEEMIEREAALEILERQCLFISVAKRNPGKGLLCESQKVNSHPSFPPCNSSGNMYCHLVLQKLQHCVAPVDSNPSAENYTCRNRDHWLSLIQHC